MDLKIEYLYKGTIIKDYYNTQLNDNVKIHYSLFLKNGDKINTPYDKIPFYFEKLGYANDFEDVDEDNNGNVIKGLDKIVTDIRLGDFVRVEIPSEYAYGEIGIPGLIPKNSILIYYLQLIYIQRNDNIFNYPNIINLNKLIKTDNIIKIKEELEKTVLK